MESKQETKVEKTEPTNYQLKTTKPVEPLPFLCDGNTYHVWATRS